MKKIIVAAFLASFAYASFAACPIGTRYDCQSTFNGKMSCGCR